MTKIAKNWCFVRLLLAKEIGQGHNTPQNVLHNLKLEELTFRAKHKTSGSKGSAKVRLVDFVILRTYTHTHTHTHRKLAKWWSHGRPNVAAVRRRQDRSTTKYLNSTVWCYCACTIWGGQCDRNSLIGINWGSVRCSYRAAIPFYPCVHQHRSETQAYGGRQRDHHFASFRWSASVLFVVLAVGHKRQNRGMHAVTSIRRNCRQRSVPAAHRYAFNQSRRTAGFP